MTKLAIAMARNALRDRKGVTALEYGVIAAAIVAILLVAVNTLFTNIGALFSGITFP
jgi:Flp pilus assembly pilin Flp